MCETFSFILIYLTMKSMNKTLISISWKKKSVLSCAYRAFLSTDRRRNRRRRDTIVKVRRHAHTLVHNAAVDVKKVSPRQGPSRYAARLRIMQRLQVFLCKSAYHCIMCVPPHHPSRPSVRSSFPFATRKKKIIAGRNLIDCNLNVHHRHTPSCPCVSMNLRRVAQRHLAHNVSATKCATVHILMQISRVTPAARIHVGTS